VKKTDRLVFCWEQGAKKGKKLLFFRKKRILLPKIAIL
jgi:hypothetical protein